MAGAADGDPADLALDPDVGQERVGADGLADRPGDLADVEDPEAERPGRARRWTLRRVQRARARLGVPRRQQRPIVHRSHGTDAVVARRPDGFPPGVRPASASGRVLERQDPVRGGLQPHQRQLAGLGVGQERGERLTARGFGAGEQDEVRSGRRRAFGEVAGGEPARRGGPVERVRHRDAPEAELAPEQRRVDRRRPAGRRVGVPGRVGGVREHHDRQARPDRHPVREEPGRERGPARPDRDHVLIRVEGRVAEAGKVLEDRDHAAGLEALGEGDREGSRPRRREPPRPVLQVQERRG